MSFKFQSDSINTKTLAEQYAAQYTLNSNLILLILALATLLILATYFKFQSDSINTIKKRPFFIVHMYFKFQSDSINTIVVNPVLQIFDIPLNSNLILLILKVAPAGSA